MTEPFVSILMLVHNAPEFTEMAVRSVKMRTRGVKFELVVVDNDSQEPTQKLLRSLKSEGLIDTLEFLPYNSLFAEGNNFAAGLASPAATHFLLLNSDVEIHKKAWLSRLLRVHERGITSYGIVLEPLRVDGYCLLIDADLYRDQPLDEGHQWWWAVTKQQAGVLRGGLSVQGYGEHERYLHHFGGKSGDAFKNARGMDVSREEAISWFAGREPRIIDRYSNRGIPGHDPAPLPRRAADMLSTIFARR